MSDNNSKSKLPTKLPSKLPANKVPSKPLLSRCKTQTLQQMPTVSNTNLKPRNAKVDVASEPPKKIRKVVSRRSKSFSSPHLARTLVFNSKITAKASAKTDENSKVKVVKKAPPPYDFKARFGLLLDKHKVLVEKHKDATEKLQALVGFDDLKMKYEKLSETHETLLIKNDANEKCIESIKNENKFLLAEVENLKQRNARLSVDYANLQQVSATATENLDNAHRKIKEIEACLDCYKTSLEYNEAQRRSLLNQVQDLKGNIRVFCRLRPPLESETDLAPCHISCVDDCTLEISSSKQSKSGCSNKMECKQEFSFDRVFTSHSSQQEVFEDLAQLVQSTLDGYNVCVFAYGQTGSGKTHTMQGTENDLGMIPRTLDLLFQRIHEQKKTDWQFEVEISFLEIYNDTIRDLLTTNRNLVHNIHYNEGRGTTVTNLQIEAIDSAEAAKKLMTRATNNRAVATTSCNEHSSRSHAVTRIHIKAEHAASKFVGSLNLVDLAGSENAKTSDRLGETKSINKSLSNLGTVMLALHNKETTHVPYRNCKLTYLLQNCLGGNSKTLMFVNIAPFEDCYNETISSLRFAANVKKVKLGSRRQRLT